MVVRDPSPLPKVTSTSSSAEPSVIIRPGWISPSWDATEMVSLPPSALLLAVATSPVILANSV